MEGICESSVQDSTAMVKSRFRYYQQEADDAIYSNEDKRCVVVMFCGTGKSLVMRYCKIVQDKQLVVYVFPSLSLIEQFHSSYLMDFDQDNLLKVSSDEESESTTDYEDIMAFLCKSDNKIVCVTYQSYETLTCCLGDNRIDVCIYDEAHHVVGEKYQQAILDTDYCDKQVFFTATPRNANGIVMMDTNQPDIGVCGEVVYKYNYFRGVMEGYLNAFDVRIDFYSEHTNNSVYESIARAILASGNSRVLTFHADVNGDRDTSVLNFVVEHAFIAAFDKVLYTEFPERVGFYKSVKMIAFHSKMKTKCLCCRRRNYKVSCEPCCRFNVLNYFDSCPDDHVFVIASCQTLGEGIDTKRANMVVFVDPKSSVVGIMQNIGRIVRKLLGENKPNSTILLAEWVDKEKYLECEGDPDKRDEVIRTNLNKGGDFSNILNVFCALKQQDEDLFDACLNYPNSYSPQEIEGNLANHGFKIAEEEEPSYLADTLGKVLGVEIEDYEDLDDEEILEQAAEDNDVCIEVHSDSLENPVTTYNSDAKEVVRIFKSTDEEENEVYQPIVREHDGETRTTDQIPPPRKRFSVKVHTNPDIKMLWNIRGDDLEFSKDVCSCIIECEVVDMWNQRLEELKTEVLLKQKIPHYKTFIGRWYKTQSGNYNNGKLDPRRIPLWIEFITVNAILIKTIVEKWKETLVDLKKFIMEEKRTPNQSLKNPCREKTLGLWYSRQKLSFTRRKYNFTEKKFVDEWLKFIDECGIYIKNRHQEWESNLKEVMEFFKDKERRISMSKKTTGREKTLAKWCSHQRTNYENYDDILKEPKYRLMWEKFYEEHKRFLNKDSRWHSWLSVLKQFINIIKRKPVRSDETTTMSRPRELPTVITEENLLAVESKLSFWGKNNTRNFIGRTQNMADNDIYNTWAAYIKGDGLLYFGLEEDIFDYKLKQVSNFIESNEGLLPTRTTEKEMCSWINNNKIYYKQQKCGMESLKRRNKFLTFMKKYSIVCCDKNGKHYLNESVEEPQTPSDAVTTKRKTKSAKLPATKKAKEQEKETVEQFRTRTKSVISQYHNKFCKMRSENMAQYFQENPQEFIEYHRVRDENFQTYDPVDWPYNRIIMELEKIKSNRRRSVIDMGCGTAKISAHFKDDRRFQFTNYDHVAINETVQVCDISQMPLEDNLVDICVMSLCLWGPNKEDSITEAYRVLDTNGTLYLIDSTMRWSNTDELGNIVGPAAQILGDLLLETGFNIASHNVEDKFCMFICVKK